MNSKMCNVGLTIIWGIICSWPIQLFGWTTHHSSHPSFIHIWFDDGDDRVASMTRAQGATLLRDPDLRQRFVDSTDCMFAERQDVLESAFEDGDVDSRLD